MAYALGLFSALPFLVLTPEGLAATSKLGESFAQPPLPITQPAAAKLQLLYGSSILSFLGAPHWGLALAFPSSPVSGLRLAWGVVPSLAAVPLPALPEPTARAALFASLGGALVVDAAFAYARLLPRWYLLHLRLPLTLVACGSLLLNVPASLPPPPRTQQQQQSQVAPAEAKPAAVAKKAKPFFW